MRNGRFGIIVIAVLMLAAGLLALAGPRLVEKPAARLPAPPKAGQSGGVTARGVVESVEDVELSSQIMGTISRVLVEEGAEVSKGQLLLEFEQGKLEAQRRQVLSGLAAAQARLNEARTGYRREDIQMVDSGKERAKAVYDQARDEHERQRRLLAQGATTQVEVNRAIERLKVAEGDLAGADANLNKHRLGVRSETREQAAADVDRARADLQYIDSIIRDYRVYSPISGIITERHKDRGEGTDIGSPLFHLINPSKLRVRAELEETELGKVKEGQTVEVTTEAFRDKIFHGRVSKIFPVIRKKTQKSFDPMASFDINTQKVYIILDNYSGLRNGVTVTARFK